MKTPRLLPVVIAATSALLLLKGIGLVTDGGYVLVGMEDVQAQEGEGASELTSTEPTMELAPEATIEDSSPTLEDSAPVLSLGGETTSEGEGGSAEGGESSGAEGGSESLPPDPVAQAEEASSAIQAACPPIDAMAGEGEAGAESSGETADVAAPDCVPVPLNQYGDAVAMELNSEGMLVPVAGDATSGDALLTRLGERRETLDARETELDMRLALVEAAEKRIEERTAALKALEARINALVEEKKTDEKEQFAGIVAMYETMKPKEASVIFDTLDTQMLVRIARAMNPRKLAPILARMEPQKAKALTSGLAREEAEPQLDANTVEDLANLPQIVGQ